MNCIVIKGRLTKEPEQRTTASGDAVTNFTVAVDRRFSKEKQADFIDCVAWKKTGETIGKHFQKGQEIVVSGRLESRQWKDKNDNNRTSWEINVDNFDFCGSKQSGGQPNQTATNDFVEVDDDELPF